MHPACKATHATKLLSGIYTYIYTMPALRRAACMRGGAVVLALLTVRATTAADNDPPRTSSAPPSTQARDATPRNARIQVVNASTFSNTGVVSSASTHRRVGDSWGTNIHWTTPPGGKAEATMLGSAYRLARMDFKWGEIETTKGIYNFSAYDRLLAVMQGVGVRLSLL